MKPLKIITYVIIISGIHMSCGINKLRSNDDSAEIANYPYLEAGEKLYKDSKNMNLDTSTPLNEVYLHSYFAGLPEFKQAIGEQRIEAEGNKLTVVGDGGFGGMTMIRDHDFPLKLVVIFPEFEFDRVIQLRRVRNGWEVVTETML